ncbi:MAG: hypothetical protein U5K79_12170 [Cyclobacteriaceae bacterium]|nr:hypothetical protein [Cyclobacteriaceae bacterium]
MNKLPIHILVVLLLFCSSVVLAQSRDQGSSREPSSKSDRGATYDVRMSKQKKKGKSKNSMASQYDRKVEEHHELVKANAKKNEKIAREMEKPQYSDPTYFGHKKEPKKRPPGKKKFCKECGMVH